MSSVDVGRAEREVIAFFPNAIDPPDPKIHFHAQHVRLPYLFDFVILLLHPYLLQVCLWCDIALVASTSFLSMGIIRGISARDFVLAQARSPHLRAVAALQHRGIRVELAE